MIHIFDRHCTKGTRTERRELRVQKKKKNVIRLELEKDWVCVCMNVFEKKGLLVLENKTASSF